MRPFARPPLAAAFALTVLALASCTGGASASPESAVAGHVSGHIFGTDGKPLSIAGAKVRVSVAGLSTRGENVSLSAPVAADGSWDIEPPPGNFVARATLDVPWKGKTYNFTLHPVQDNSVGRSSAAGFVQDFQWRIQGLRAGSTEDATDHTHWYGSAITMGFQGYRNDIDAVVPQPPFGTKAVFTFTPTGPLIDGSEGKALTFERPFDKLTSGLTSGTCCDIPVGTYRISGAVVSPEGKSSPCQIQKAYKEFVDALEVTIAPGEHGLPSSKIVGFAPAPR